MRDLYPEDKKIQDYIFEKIKQVANLFGFFPYDGPVLENIEIYLDKTAKELIDRQTFQVKTKDNELLVMRPEMTPSLARMVAKKAGQLIFPLKLFNLGLRFRYEAPQKGRAREFYQADFDILGSTSLLADAEIINTAIQIFKTLGATKNDFVLYLNSRQETERKLSQLGFSQKQYPQLLNAFDKKDKLSPEKFSQLLSSIEKNPDKVKKLTALLNSTPTPSSPYFNQLFSLLKKLKIDQYCQYNPNIVRGLDYYTGLVFEIWPKDKKIKRALLGGGRYDNLISNFNPKNKISGIGFATSDVILLEFLKSKKLLPSFKSTEIKVLVSVFNQELVDKSIEITNLLRENNISTEIFFDDKKLDKQLKYADKKSIPYVIIIGPKESSTRKVVFKDMKSNKQQILLIEEVVKQLIIKPQTVKKTIKY